MSDSLHQFERMHYYAGQLLTARNFEDEQKYMNGKRELINRLKFGKGIISGLVVKQEDPIVEKRKIRITAGVALDKFGREIVKEIDEVTSISQGHPNEPCWVYVEYHDQETDPVPSTNPCTRQESCNFNRYKEISICSITFNQPSDNVLVLARIQLDAHGNISTIECTPPQKVYNDLEDLIHKMERKINHLENELEKLRLESRQFEEKDK